MRSSFFGILAAFVSFASSLQAQSSSPVSTGATPGLSGQPVVTEGSRVSPDTVPPLQQPTAPSPAPPQAPAVAAQRASTDGRGETPTPSNAPAFSPAYYPLYEPTSGSERQWYGWQTLSADGAALAMISVSLADVNSSVSTPLAIGSLVTYSVGAPIVHLVHEHGGKALGSLGLRVGLPLGGALLGAAIAQPCGGDFGCVGEAALGLVVGMAGAIAIDAAVLANEDRPPPQRAISATPFVAVDSQRTWVGVLGTF